MRAMETLSLRVTPKQGGISVMVFNTLGWTRGGWVETYLVKSGWDGGQSLNIDRVVAQSSGGSDYPVEIIDRHSRKVRFYANAPAFGYGVFHSRAATETEMRPAQLQVSDDGYTIDTQFQTVKFDRKGGFISSLLSKDMGSIQSGKALGRLEVHWERPAGMSAWVLGRIDRSEVIEP